MKSLSGSIVVLAGMTGFAGGGSVTDGDTQAVFMGVGIVVALIGLVGWAASMFRTPSDPRP